MKKILLLLLMSNTIFSQIERVEPPFWWSNMNLSSVQIMFYGKNINQYDVSVNKDVIIENIQKTENPNYIFVTINTKNIPATELLFSFKTKNKIAFTHKYTINLRKVNSKFRKSFDSSDVIYLIMSDRFANGNPDNDSDKILTEKLDRTNPNGRHGGDIEGIIKHLDYIKELGATAVWPTPLCQDNDEKGSYHTYGQSDVYAIDSRFGTNDDYVRLSSELHQLGMKNIMDYVTNHWGWKHWMMNDLPTNDWIHQFPQYTQTNHRRESLNDIYASKIDAQVCSDGWFVKTMPDLNQSNPLVLKYLTQNAIWWIEYADLDGFRVDTYPYNDKDGISKWTKAITDEYPNFNIVGEAWLNSPAKISYWQKDSKIGALQSFNSYLPSVMDFPLFDAFSTVFNQDKQEWEKGMINFYLNFTNDFLYANPNNILTFIENHDTNRFNDIYKSDFKKYQMAMTLLATVRGIPQLYYGSEIGMTGNKDKAGDGDIRRDFPGGWSADSSNAFSKSGRTAEQQKYFDFTKKLFNWRKSKAVIHSGKLMHYIPENNVYVYFRYNETESVMVIVNNSNEKQTFKTNRFQESILNYKSGKDIISDKIIDITNEVSMEPKSVLILELK
ncbi:MAG: glycoside hydrolase family 13 protein [Flavobacterium sp.]|nr:glycoside hydrolase family 13 protein [Flavobacterium sp.]